MFLNKKNYREIAEAAIGSVLYKKVLLKISQILQENPRVGVSFLIKLHALRPATLLKRNTNTGVFL